MAQCPACGKLNDSRLDNCVYCGAHMKAAVSSRAQRSTKPCPNCGALVADTDIICRACNTNLLTRQKVDSGSAPSKPEGGGVNWPFVGGGIAVILAIVGLVGLSYALSARDPLNRARTHIEAGEELQAITVLAEHLQRAPDDEQGLMLMGRLQWNVGDFERAANNFERAATVNPGNTDATRWAVLSMARFFSEPVSARMAALLEKSVDANPDESDLLTLLGLTQGIRGDVSLAADTFERTLQRFGYRKDVQLAMAAAQAMSGSYVQAETSLKQLGDAQPGDDAQSAAAAYVSLLRGRDHAALGNLESAASVEPGLSDPALQFELGRLYAALGRFADAEVSMKRVSELDPDHTGAIYLQAVALHAQGVYQEALGLVEMLSRGDSAEAGRAALLAAQIHLDQDSPEPARILLDTASRKGVGGAEYFTTRGRLETRDREFQSARRSIDRALQADPAFAPAYLESGLLHVRLDRFDEGLKHLERYLYLTRDSLVRTKNREVEALVDQLRQAAGPRLITSS